jgi:hypothetical protein
MLKYFLIFKRNCAHLNFKNDAWKNNHFEGLTFECFNMQKDKLDFLHQILSIETLKVQWNLFPKKH